MANSSIPESPIKEPIAIYKLAHRYLLYDINVVTYLRRKHNIMGVLVGSLPQASQQNVFLGLPLELMPEEARLLVEKGVAHIVDDVAAHKSNFLGPGLSAEERKAYQAALRKQGQGAARDASKRSDDRKKAALKKLETDNWNDIPDDMFQPSTRRNKKRAEPREASSASSTPPGEVDEDDSLFSSSSTTVPSAGSGGDPPRYIRPIVDSEPSLIDPDPYVVTPTVSYPPLGGDEEATTDGDWTLIEVPKSYPLYKHLHEKDYFLAPGIRFGCQYMAYPGDPLRFHSHFLCNGMDWDEEYNLLDLIGGGRLATGVKKGLVFGGEEPSSSKISEESARPFAVEWAGM